MRHHTQPARFLLLTSVGVTKTRRGDFFDPEALTLGGGVSVFIKQAAVTLHCSLFISVISAVTI